MGLLKDLRMSLLMIYIIHKILVLRKNYLTYFDDSIFECFFKESKRLLFFLKKKTFFTTYSDGKLKTWRRKHN